MDVLVNIEYKLALYVNACFPPWNEFIEHVVQLDFHHHEQPFFRRMQLHEVDLDDFRCSIIHLVTGLFNVDKFGSVLNH